MTDIPNIPAGAYGLLVHIWRQPCRASMPRRDIASGSGIHCGRRLRRYLVALCAADLLEYDEVQECGLPHRTKFYRITPAGMSLGRAMASAFGGEE